MAFLHLSFISSSTKISSNRKGCDRLKLSYPIANIKEYRGLNRTRHVKRCILLWRTAELYYMYSRSVPSMTGLLLWKLCCHPRSRHRGSKAESQEADHAFNGRMKRLLYICVFNEQ
ncbi:hypothetical protein RSOL_494690 [Rhizoctonia solani AG-3 Rhs1AP]|uniref:Uncharacterized protein n=2 Tax=Rhizoctonia solani AG-3 TaxID=1086053 RepID=A0A074RT29_9AGAM|nr:hypothetical protein RSOL_494690 [Rhizoctonia solani AG-3 Rhs1AP]KEP48495.1 hypothetical protein V565_123190 [Rhizoctonia solani 123E]